MPGAEPIVIERWLKTTLAASGAVTAIVGSGANARIYADTAPANSPFPLIVFGFMSASDVMEVGQTRFMGRATYLVRGIGQTRSKQALEALAAAIDAALHRQGGSVTGGVVLSCTREEPFSLAEQLDGVDYRHLGGLYRIAVQ